MRHASPCEARTELGPATEERAGGRQPVVEGCFDAVIDRGTPWLDQSNASVHAQLFSVCIEAARDLQDKSCIDLGCGRGQLAGALRAPGRVGPGGRLVAVCPHAGCPIVRRVEARFEGRYRASRCACASTAGRKTSRFEQAQRASPRSTRAAARWRLSWQSSG
jgi:hypothetical protein